MPCLRNVTLRNNTHVARKEFATDSHACSDRKCLFFIYWILSLWCGLLPHLVQAQAENSARDEKNVSREEAGVPLSPAGRIIVDTNPTSPAELIKAIDQLIVFGDRQQAKEYAVALGDTVAATPDLDLVSIGDHLGSVPLLKIIRTTALDPRARAFCKNVLVAVRERDIDPQRLKDLADKTSSEDLIERRSAIAQLRAAGPDAVAPLLQMLLSGEPSDNRAAEIALIGLGVQAAPPILAAIQTKNKQFRVQLLSILSRMQSLEATNDLLIEKLNSKRLAGAIKDPTSMQMIERVKRSIDRALSDPQFNPASVAEQKTLWEWNDQQPGLTHREVSSFLYSAWSAYRLARALSQAAPNDETILLEGTAFLEWEKLNQGLDKPISPSVVSEFKSIAKKYSPQGDIHALDFAEAVFERAIEKKYTPAAIAAAEVLANVAVSEDAQEALLTRRGAAAHPLIVALGQKDRRLRMACCEAILHLTSEYPFVGAGTLSDALAYFASADGKPRILIADNRTSRRQRLISLFGAAGYKTVATTSGREAVQAAQNQPDCVVGFIASNIGTQSFQDILHSLRLDARTAQLPLAILVDPDELAQRRLEADQHPLTMCIIAPHQADGAQADIDALINLLGIFFVPEQERLAEARRAIQMYGELIGRIPDSGTTDRWDHILIGSLQVEALASAAADVLAQIKTPAAQKGLVDAASATYLPLTTRQAAAKAFQQSVAKHGIGLSAAEIQRQKDRYDATEGSDPKEEELLWSILEAINRSANSPSGN